MDLNIAIDLVLGTQSGHESQNIRCYASAYFCSRYQTKNGSGFRTWTFRLNETILHRQFSLDGNLHTVALMKTAT